VQAYPQADATQVAVAFAALFGHTVAQVPQWLTSVLLLVSHPLRLVFSLALQSLNGAVQLLMLHAPAAHAGVPLALLQAAAQAPQAPVLVLVLVSQPLALFPSQLP
jgi:hypothetical protein